MIRIVFVGLVDELNNREKIITIIMIINKSVWDSIVFLHFLYRRIVLLLLLLLFFLLHIAPCF